MVDDGTLVATTVDAAKKLGLGEPPPTPWPNADVTTMTPVAIRPAVGAPAHSHENAEATHLPTFSCRGRVATSGQGRLIERYRRRQTAEAKTPMWCILSYSASGLKSRSARASSSTHSSPAGWPVVRRALPPPGHFGGVGRIRRAPD